jgi:hypothetical protein
MASDVSSVQSLWRNELPITCEKSAIRPDTKKRWTSSVIRDLRFRIIRFALSQGTGRK